MRDAGDRFALGEVEGLAILKTCLVFCALYFDVVSDLELDTKVQSSKYKVLKSRISDSRFEIQEALRFKI